MTHGVSSILEDASESAHGRCQSADARGSARVGYVYHTRVDLFFSPCMTFCLCIVHGICRGSKSPPAAFTILTISAESKCVIKQPISLSCLFL